MNVVKDLVSIIIPVYNRQNVIGECIDSIMAQSYQNFEIVLIDDGSTDGTLEMIRDFASKEPRIKLIVSEHGGVSAARNKGIEAASGEYIFFLDSDDVIHHLLLEALVGGLANSDAAIAGTGNVNVPEKYWYKVKERIKKDTDRGETTYQNHEETLRAVFCTSSPLALLGGVMIRHDLIGDTRFCTDLFIGEDFYFIYQNLIKGASSVFLKQKWYYCRINENNSSWDYSYSGFWSRFYRRELVWKSEEKLGRTEYADIQKRGAFGCFINCFEKNKPYSDDSKKMRKVLREYRKVLLPAMKRKIKAFYLLCVYFPYTALLLLKLKNKLKRIKLNKR